MGYYAKLTFLTLYHIMLSPYQKHIESVVLTLSDMFEKFLISHGNHMGCLSACSNKTKRHLFPQSSFLEQQARPTENPLPITTSHNSSRQVTAKNSKHLVELCIMQTTSHSNTFKNGCKWHPGGESLCQKE